MTPIEVFILRQKTRPSNREGAEFVFQFISSYEGRLIDFKSDAAISLRFNSANLVRETDDIDESLRAFIKSEERERYLIDQTHFCIEVFSFLSGSPPEHTRLAIVFVKDKEDRKNQHFPEVEAFLTRGNRWEELERWGDALGCYYIGLVLHPEQPDLLAKLGSIQLRYTRYLTEAIRNLNKAIELHPLDGNALFHLGCGYRLIANTPEIEVRGRPRDDLRRIALGLLERAAAIKSEDFRVLDELESLYQELKIVPCHKIRPGGFFS